MKIFPLFLSVFQVESYRVSQSGIPLMRYETSNIQSVIDRSLGLCQAQGLKNIDCAKLLHDQILTTNGREFSCMVTNYYLGDSNNYSAVCSERGDVDVNKTNFNDSVNRIFLIITSFLV